MTWAFAAGGSFYSLTKHSGGVSSHTDPPPLSSTGEDLAVASETSRLPLPQQGSTEKLKVKPLQMVTFTERSTRCLPNKERWLGRKWNHRPRLQEAYHPLVVRVTVTRATTLTAPDSTQWQRSPGPEVQSKNLDQGFWSWLHFHNTEEWGQNINVWNLLSSPDFPSSLAWGSA